MINTENTTVIDGGPANPIGQFSGMTLRDFFAAAVAQGIYASNVNGYEPDTEAIAERAFAQADALVSLRSVNVIAPYGEAFIVPAEPVVEEPVVEQPVVEVTRV